jgi:DNA processing protein
LRLKLRADEKRRGPVAGRFRQRNRIISGLCLGVVVVEVVPRSGSPSTGHHAMEENREIFGVPGPVDSLASRPPVAGHRLIKDGSPASSSSGRELCRLIAALEWEAGML